MIKTICLIIILGCQIILHAQSRINSKFCENGDLIVQGLYEECLAMEEASRYKVNTFNLQNGLTLEYGEQGKKDGSTIIFLHGLSDSRISFEKVLGELPPNVHAIAVSQRGHGNSSKNFNTYHPKDMADDIAKLVKQLKLGPIILVGHSMGGVVAQQFAIDHPDLLSALVIIGSEAKFGDNPAVIELYNDVLKRDSITYQYLDEFQKSTIAKPVDDVYYRLLVDEGMKVPASIFKTALKGIVETDLLPYLCTVNIPTLMVYGEKDSVCPYADQLLMKSKIPGVTFLLYEGNGHALHWESPKRFVDDLLQFINLIDNK